MLDVLPEGSQVSDTDESAFLFLSNLLTHVPWGIDSGLCRHTKKYFMVSMAMAALAMPMAHSTG